jgi:putative membrane protein
MDHLWLAFGIALGIASQPVPGQNGKTAQPAQQAPAARTPLKAGVDRQDEKFIERAARAAHAEIAAGKLAAARGSSEEVKAFAREVVEHHGKANYQLEEIAIKKGVTWPTVPHWWQQRELKKLQSLAGNDFDRRYMQEAGVDDHEDTVKLFRKAQKDVKDPELKAFFDRMLPTVEKHYEMARTLERSLKDGAPAAGSGSASAGSSRSK